MIENLSDTVIMPIAGIILTFVMCYELIQMVIDRNNMHDFPPSDIFKWMMKTFIAVVLVTNTFPIMMGIFDVAQSVTEFAPQGRKEDFMAYVPIPKDLSNVKTKVVLNLTKRIISIRYWKGSIN